MRQFKICVQRSGYATIDALTKQAAVESAMNLTANDFDWEAVAPDMIREEVEIVEEL